MCVAMVEQFESWMIYVKTTITFIWCPDLSFTHIVSGHSAALIAHNHLFEHCSRSLYSGKSTTCNVALCVKFHLDSRWFLCFCWSWRKDSWGKWSFPWNDWICEFPSASHPHDLALPGIELGYRCKVQIVPFYPLIITQVTCISLPL